jgi:PAS domain S-box-containing protein
MSNELTDVLLVEDEAAHVEAISRAMGAHDPQFRVRAVGTLRDFAAEVAVTPPDIAVMDLNLPDGLAQSVLNSPPESGAFPILVMTSHGDQETAVAALRAGALDYVVKSPESFAGLPRLVERTLREWRLRIEHQQAQVQLRQTKEELERFFALVPDMICIASTDGYFKRLNPVWEKALGFSQEELLARPLADFIHPEDRENTFKEIEKQSSGQNSGGFVNRYLCKDGSYRWLEWQASPAIGNLLFAAARDITERKQKESQQQMMIEVLLILNQSGNLPEVIDKVIDAVRRGLDVDAIGVRLRHGNDFPYYRMDGFSKSFVLAENHLCCRDHNGAVSQDELGHPILECACGLVLSGQADLSHPLFTPGGTFWSNDALPLLDLPLAEDPRTNPRNRCMREGYRSLALVPIRAQAEIVGLLQLNDRRPGRFTPELIRLLEGLGASIGSDLARREDAERLRLALDAAQEGLWDWDLETDTGHASPRFNLLLGYEPGELNYSHRTWQGLVHPEDLPATQNDLEEFLQNKQGVWSREHRLRRKSGDYIWVLAKAKVVEKSPGGQALRMAGTIADISERRNIQEQLLQAQKMESVGRLAGGVAHDFNNLLTVINGYSELLLKRLPPQDPSRPHLGEIQKAGERAASLTQQLLAFSRRQVMQPRVLDLNELVLEAQRLIERIIGEDVHLATVLDPALGKVTADPGQLNQVLLNLAVNARDAMPDGGRLTLETTNVDFDESAVQSHMEAHPGHYVELAVNDSGVGMDEETQRRLFEPFFTTKPQGAGTGLGLATVYGIVRQSGGWITVSSELGEGSTFTIYLPRATEPVAAASRAPELPTPRQGTETVMVVEDQEGVRDLVSSVLRKYNYRVLEATGGEEALQIAGAYAGPIHLIVTDVVMSRMSGRDLAIELKSQRPESLILYISGYPDDVLGQHGILDAKVAFLQKPFSPEALAGKVRQLLDEARLRPILVVDDDASIRCLLCQILADAGYPVEEANDGVEALALMKNSRFSAVVTDLVMPEKEGMDVITEIRKLYPAVKVIAISGAYGGRFLKPARLIGAHATLVKPINEEALLTTISSLVGTAK